MNNLRYVFAYTCISLCIKLGQFYFPSLNLWQELNISYMKILTKIKYDWKKIISRLIKVRMCRKVPSITFWPQGDPNPGTPRVYEILSKGDSGVKWKTEVGRIERKARSGTLKKGHWHMKVEEKIKETQKTIKPLTLIVITFDFMSDDYETITNCLGSLSEASIFSFARVLIYGREAESMDSSLASAPAVP